MNDPLRKQFRMKIAPHLHCPECGGVMENLGNVSRTVYTSYPPQWDEVWICESCRVRKTVRVHGEQDKRPDLSGYLEIGEGQEEPPQMLSEKDVELSWDDATVTISPENCIKFEKDKQ